MRGVVPAGVIGVDISGRFVVLLFGRLVGPRRVLLQEAALPAEWFVFAHAAASDGNTGLLPENYTFSTCARSSSISILSCSYSTILRLRKRLVMRALAVMPLGVSTYM